MARGSAICTSFRLELGTAIHDLEGDTLKVALYPQSATLTKDTTAYSSSEESTGDGYTAGGATLTNCLLTLDGDGYILLSDDVEWAAVTLTVGKFLLYNASKSNRAIAVYDLGQDIAVSAQTFTLTPGTLPFNSWLKL